MFIVLKIHRESLRQMMQLGRVNHSIKIQVLEMLKDITTTIHGDIKDLLVFHDAEINRDLKNQSISRRTF